MIHITQGFEKGIGIEVFLKCLPLFSQSKLDQILFYVNKHSLEMTCKTLKINFQIKNNQLNIYNRKIDLYFIEKSSYSQTLNCILMALKNINQGDSLFTLPSTKSEFKYEKKELLGHTEFLRYFYKNENLGMYFNSPNINLLLITDHLPLNQIFDPIQNINLIKEKINHTIKHAHNFLNLNFKKIVFMGINPHAGENGLLGNEENIIKKNFKIKGIPIEFIPADSILNLNLPSDVLIVSFYHDQGLTYFKTVNQFLGANITTGLDYNRISVDHGTAENLYGKNLANPQGCYYCLDLILK